MYQILAILYTHGGRIEMSDQVTPDITDITSDDKLWTALAYIFTPLVPIILLLMEDKKDRPFIKAHSMQALIFGVVFYILVSVLSVVIVGLCLIPIGWGLQIYWAIKAYNGELVNIPVITDFVKNQGWA
jgi:uncharacterized membrane protein